MFQSTTGPARQRLEDASVQKLEAAGALVHDDRRLRSFFFDGRFLTARDLTREQTYFLTRQADLGRGGGTGVIAGLRVKVGTTSRSLHLSAGHGVTPSGESVVIPQDLTEVRLDDIPEIQRLDAAFGLSPVPREPSRNRSGLYVVALRPVEYTAHPVASYPSSMGTTRQVQDGDIIEATAITLIPYPDAVSGQGFDARRSRVAHEIFTRDGGQRLPVDALPLAMVAVERGIISWVDEFLVRREVGSEQEDFLGLGQAPRMLREAHLLQYQQHLRDVLAERRKGSKGERFSASEHFRVLPPAGPLPAAAVDSSKLTEVFFPPEVDVELSVVSYDELGTLLRESLLLPPIDLTQTGEELVSTAVLVLVPVPRRRMDQALSLLFPAQRAGTVKLRSAAPGQVARRLPGDALQALLQRMRQESATPASGGLADAAWASVLSGTELLWYVRRRNLPSKPLLVGERAVEPDDRETAFTSALRQAELDDEFASLPGRATALAIGEIYGWLESLRLEALTTAPQWFASAAGELLRLKWLDVLALDEVKARYAYAERGTGLQALLNVLSYRHARVVPQPVFARSSSVVELDKISFALVPTWGDLEIASDVVNGVLAGNGTLDQAVAQVRMKFPNLPV
jgi:hypothetical protein